MVTPTEINEFKYTVENYDKKISEATAVIKKGVDVRIDPAKLSEGHVQLLTNLNEKFEAWNKRWSTLCKAVASTGKMKVEKEKKAKGKKEWIELKQQPCE